MSGSWAHLLHKVYPPSQKDSKPVNAPAPSCWLVSEDKGAKGEKGKLFTLRWAQNRCGQLRMLRASF